MQNSGFWLALGAAVAVGAALRLLGIESQILGGDELHTLRAALDLDLGEILVTYRVADHSIPLTALYEIWMMAGGTPSELILRCPILIAGVLTVALLPLACRRAAGKLVAALLAGLLALSPVLVLYSRIVRSYMPLVLLAGLAVLAFARWLETRGGRAAAGYVLAALAAIWFHPLAAPFVTAPLLYAACWRLRDRRASAAPSWRSLLIVGGGLALGLCVMLVPARESLLDLLSTGRQVVLPRPAAWPVVARLQLGSAHGGVLLLYGSAAVTGLVALARSRPCVAAYTATLVGVQIAALLVLRPFQIDVPLVLNRYLLVCTPVLLFWVSAGLVLPWRTFGVPAAGTAAAVAGAVVLVVGFATGPLADRAFRTSDFVHRNDFLAFHQARPTIDATDVPGFYRALPEEPGALVEFPWHPWWVFSRAIPIYQKVHGRRVLVSTVDPELIAYASSLRNFVEPTPDALAGSGARWVVVHLDMGAEEERVQALPDVGRSRIPPEIRSRFHDKLRLQAAKLASRLEASWGRPDHADEHIRAWRLPRTSN
jgi:hypothetical protein